jgi:microcystin-dependent protein
MTPYLGEVRAFGGNFAPYGWALCNGEIISIAQNDALFALIGTTYGGDGVTTFGLPDLRGKVLVSQGQGPGLTNRPIGQASGSETVTLQLANLPQHNHNVIASTTPANSGSPTNNMLAAPVDSTVTSDKVLMYLPNNTTATKTVVPLDQSVIVGTGGNQPHDNLIPIVTISYIIALQGIFPSPN